MKYTSNNTPRQCFLTNNKCYKSTKEMDVKGVLWHSTGANNPNLKRYVQPSSTDPNRADLLAYLGTNANKNDWNNQPDRSVGMNAFIGKTASGEVATVQTMPWNWRPWGCASGSKGSCNNGWIQFEICEDGLTDATYFNKIYQEACEFTAYMCKMFNLDPQGTVKMNGVDVPVILCHQDSYKLGMGNNHGDVLHWFKKHNKTMQNVRDDVQKLLGATQPTPAPAPAPVVTTPAPTPTPVVTGLTGSTNEEKIWNYLMGKLNNPYGVAGIMGNIKAESSFISNNLQGSYEKKLGYTDETYTAAVDSGKYTRDQFAHDSAGYGLAQWTYWSRKQALYDYMKKANVSIGDLKTQLEYLCYDLSTNYKTVWSTCLNAKTIQEASDAVVLKYERPASVLNEATKQSSCDKRAEYGKLSYDKFAKTTTVTTPTPTPVVTPTPTPVEVKTTTSPRMANASQSEHESATGTAGDQTGKEVLIRKWYNRPWTYIAIHPDADIREKIAIAGETACVNENIGYSQSTRNTFYQEAKKVNFDMSKITTPCNTDCSAFVNCCVVAAGTPGASYGSNGWTTKTMEAALVKAGFKIIKESKYLTDASYSVRGAIYCNSGAHANLSIDNGTNYAKTLAAADVANTAPSTTTTTPSTSTTTTTTTKSVKASKSAKFKDATLAGTYVVTGGTLNIRDGAGTNHKALTQIPSGTKVKCYGYYSVVSGVKWLYIQFTRNGTTYTAFASGKYLKKE